MYPQCKQLSGTLYTGSYDPSALRCEDEQSVLSYHLKPDRHTVVESKEGQLSIFFRPAKVLGLICWNFGLRILSGSGTHTY